MIRGSDPSVIFVVRKHRHTHTLLVTEGSDPLIIFIVYGCHHKHVFIFKHS